MNYTYQPALKYRVLNRFYDLACSLARLGRGYKKVLADIPVLQAGNKILDVGCGTGTLIEVLKDRYPSISAHGVDADDSILQMAMENLRRKGISAELVRAYAEQLPFADNTFDAVFCILTLHHVPSSSKVKALTEMRRVLKPSGVLVLSDYGKKKSMMRGPGQFLFERKENLKDHFEGRIPGYIAESGLRLETEKKYNSQVFIWVAKKKAGVISDSARARNTTS